jgi:hypothetical protein
VSTDRVIGITSLIIGIPAFLVLFISSAQRREAILCLVLVALVLGFRAYQTYLRNLPQFSILEIRKHLAIKNVDGTNAHFVATRKMRANFNGIVEFWHRNIIQDGTIVNIQIDQHIPDEVKIISGTTNVCKRFARPLTKGEEVTTELSFDYENSFCNPTREALIHNNPFKVREVEVVIDLPKPCIKAELRQTYMGEEGKLLPTPRLSNGNRKIEIKIKKPRIGASYHVEWDW